jgi:VWFA-related protein
MKNLMLGAMLILLSTAVMAQDVRERSDVNLVLIDARVTDARGNQILGLGKDDFVVNEDGQTQPIESVEYFTNRRLLTSPESSADFKVERTREERDFIIFFDRETVEGTNVTSEILQARQAAERFVKEELKPQDRVAVASYDVRLRLQTDFTTDRQQIRRALNEAITFSKGVTQSREAPDGSILSKLDPNKMINKTGRVQDAVRLLADAVQPIPRRKILIFFTSGMDNDTVYVDEMVRSLSRANVAVYAINLLGQNREVEAEHAITRMTSATGGQYFPSVVNFFQPLKQIEQANNGYYLISYYTRRDPEKHGYQKVDVALRNPEFRIQARSGYAF